MNDSRPPSQALLDGIFEEYRALYGLAELRINALDRRVPVAGGALAAAVGTLAALPPATQIVLSLGVPLGMAWLMRTTVNHARSLEDIFRRIEEIEREVNRILGQKVLTFQSRHPSGRTDVGGRTGRESVAAVMVTVFILLCACAYQFWATHGPRAVEPAAYLCYLAAVYALVLWERIRLSRYVYKPRADIHPLSP